ncbi:Multidrug resistance-associated protein 1 [Coemansia guatemalensis]|uniref:Multidrug resistance-associated protein 1 n=1 Tax=Coemansia guatemalensis TaxID=2761395 RepID=A0A9W8LW34_9FUNG|nr:Multidrug resistance-associated protein 1 [Coemansia guatemalensis]
MVPQMAFFALSFIVAVRVAGLGSPMLANADSSTGGSGYWSEFAAIGAVVAVAFPLRYIGRLDMAKPMRAVTRARIILVTLQTQCRAFFGPFLGRMLFRQERSLLQQQKKGNLKLDDIPLLSENKSLESARRELTYDVNEPLFLLRAIFRMVWPTLIPLYIVDSLVQAINMAEIMLDAYVLHCMDDPAEHAWYQGYAAALLLVVLKVVQRQMTSASSFTNSGWSRVGNALELEFLRLPLTNTGLRKIGALNSCTHLATPLIGGMRSMQSTVVRLFMVLASARSIYRQVGWLAVVPFCVSWANTLLRMGVQRLTGSKMNWRRDNIYYGSSGTLYNISRKIQTVKLFGWERMYTDDALKKRKQRPAVLPWYSWIVQAVWFVVESVEMISSHVSAGLLVYAYALTSEGSAKPITNSDLFRVNGLVENMRADVNAVVHSIRQLQTLSRRYQAVERFLKGDFVKTLEWSADIPEGSQPSVDMSGCSFTWRKRAHKPVLKDISLHAADGEMVAVVGKSGSGKSSLLLSICGEVQMLSGSGKTLGSIAYLEQTPWIMNDSLRANILFGRKFDEALYKKVIHACAFVEDMATWPAGDMSVIGENGINISGGQRARLALARTLYSQADIYVLDDPLSAVDAHVRRHILEHVILDSGLLAGKLRIISTHALHIVPFSHQVVTLDDGKAVVTKQTPRLFHPRLDPSADSADADMSSASSESQSPSGTSGSSEQEKEASDDDENLRKWPLADNLKYAARLCGWPVLAVVSLASIIDPITSFIMDGYVLASLKTDKGALHSDVKSMLRYLFLSMASDIVSKIVCQGRRYIDDGIVDRQLDIRIDRVFVRSIVYAPLSFFNSTTQHHISQAYREGASSLNANVVGLLMYDFSGGIRTVLSLYRIAWNTPQLILVVPLIAWAESWQDTLIDPAVDSLQDVEHAMSARHNGAMDTIDNGKQMIRLFTAEPHFTHLYVANKDESERVSSVTSGLFALSRVLRTLVDKSSDMLITWMVLLQFHLVGSKVSSGEYLQYKLMAGALVSDMQDLFDIPDRVRKISNSTNVFRRFTAIESEIADASKSVKPPANWPTCGKIELRDYTMRYCEDRDPALRQINLTINPGEKIGIVGRTGAGKSSLTKALFRLVHNSSGSIFIDDVDISTIDIRCLRPRMGIIPQESTMLSSSLRVDLDPLDEFTIEEMWAALIKCNLASLIVPKHASPKKDSVDENDDCSDSDSDSDDESDGIYKTEKEKRIQWKRASLPKRALIYALGDMPRAKVESRSQQLPILDKRVRGNSGALSSGQQQLFSLCRLLMRRRKIIILDEATADMDLQTDHDIHQLIHSEFTDCTVLTIAHRLETVMNSDRIIVMEKGEVVEIGAPQELIAKGGFFAGLVKDNDFGQ